MKTAEFRLHQIVRDYVQILMKPCCSRQTTMQVKCGVTRVQMVWLGIPAVLVHWNASAVQGLPLWTCSRLVALHCHPTQPLGYILPLLGEPNLTSFRNSVSDCVSLSF